MAGQFTRIGDTVFPGDQTPCGLYEWRSTTPERHGTFSAQFVSPGDAQHPRRFWVRPLLEQWMSRGQETGSRFLEQACEYGYEIVAEMNHHTPEQRGFYRLMSWLFRNRHAGHVAMTREFMSAQDFVEFSRKGPTLLTPGIGVEQTEVRRGECTRNGMARQLLQEAYAALREAGMDLPPVTADFRGVLEVYERLLQARGHGRQENSTSLPHVEETEPLFIHGMLATLSPGPDFRRIENAVAESLVYGPTSLLEDQDAIKANPEQWEYLFGRLVEKSMEPGMTPEGFGRWLGRVREDGHLALIEGGRQLSDYDRGNASKLAAQMMHALMWWAYRLMGHCYGVFMFLVAMDMVEAGASPVEEWLFRLEHCQMDFLVGLPMDFLDRAQLRWIVQTWHRLLADVARPDLVEKYERGEFSFEAFLQIPKLLGIFAFLNRARRDADNRRNRQEQLPSESSLDRIRRPTEHEDPDEDIRRKGVDLATHPEYIADYREEPVGTDMARAEDLDQPITLTSSRCPVCHNMLQCGESNPIEVSDPTNQASFWGYCRHCNTAQVYVVDLAEAYLITRQWRR